MKNNAPKTREQIIEDGINAMTKSIINLIEPCIKQRCKQFVELVDAVNTTSQQEARRE